MNITVDYLQREKNIDLIYSVSDVMTLGVVEAVRLAKKENPPKLISVDGIADGRRAVLQGLITANVAQLPYLMGRKAVELAVNASTGEISEHTEYIPTPVLTKEVLEKNTDSELAYVR